MTNKMIQRTVHQSQNKI